MHITPDTVAAERDWVRGRADVIVPIINDTRAALGDLFDTDVKPVTEREYRREVDAVFADGDCGVNVAAYVILLRELDVAGDYPGFVVDETLGRALASTIAGGQPLALLAEATFHYADSRVHYAEEDIGTDSDDGPSGAAGLDDLDAALSAGFQTRMPGWEWRNSASPFAVDPHSRTGHE